MLVVVMCLLVLVVAGVVLRDGLRDGSTKPATTGRSRGREARHPLRSGAALVASSAGIGLLLAAALGGVLLVVGVLLRAAVDA